MQRVKAEIRPLVHKAAVFGPKREVLGEFVVGAAFIRKADFAWLVALPLQVSDSSFSFSLCWIFASQPTQFDQTRFPRQLALPMECCRRGLNSVTMPGADNTVRAGETQKSQDRQYSDKQKRQHESLPSSPR
jgi:hypothetical protein